MKKIIVCIAYITVTMHNVIWSCAHQAYNTHQQQIITLKAGKQLGKLSKSVAHISSFIRNCSTANNLPISLDYVGRPFDLETLLSLLKKTKEIVTQRPTSFKNSYVQLAHQEPLASINDPEKLLQLFNVCNFLQIDFNQSQQHEALIDAASLALTGADDLTLLKIGNSLYYDESVLNAIALKLEQLLAANKISFDEIDQAAQKLKNYNVEACVYPLVVAQHFLTHKDKEKLSENFSITLRDLLVHEKINSCLKNNALTLDLFNYHIRSLDGIMDVSNIQNITRINLSKNQLTHLPNDLSFPHLEDLDLNDNQLTYLPSRFNAPKLQFLHLDNNQFDQWPLDTAAIKIPLLEYLSVRHNSITALPNNLKADTPKLHNLFIGGNPAAQQFIQEQSVYIFKESGVYINFLHIKL